METKFFGVVLFTFVLCIGFVSAGFSNDISQKITGNVVSEIDDDFSDMENLGIISCEQIIDSGLDDDFVDYEIPDAVPFKNEVFNIYIDDEFFLSAELVDKKISGIVCESSKEVTYKIYISSSLIAEISGDNEEINPIDFYNQKRKSGELEIKAVGFVRKINMGFINFGLKIASWFN